MALALDPALWSKIAEASEARRRFSGHRELIDIELNEFSTDYGTRNFVSATLRLKCGHCYKVQAEIPPEARRPEHDAYRDEATKALVYKLRHAEATHDCAKHEADEALKRVTDRLTRRAHR